MIWFIFFGVILTILILSSLVLFRKMVQKRMINAKKRIVKISREVGKGDPGEVPPFFSRDLNQQVILNDTGMLIPELERSDRSEEFKKRIRNGVEAIFSGKTEKALEQRKALESGIIRPEVKEDVLKVIRQLKEFRSTYPLLRDLDNPEINLSQISKLIVKDPVLSGKILRVANSAYFGMPQRVNSIGHALMIIGLLNLKNILYQEELLKLLNLKSSGRDYTFESLWEHSSFTALCASYISPLFNRLDRGTLLTLGLLHDIGKFVIRTLNPIEGTGKDFIKISITEFSIFDEEELYGINHASIGRFVFEEWDFSNLMIKMVELHHAPSWITLESLGLNEESLQYLLVLFLSNQIAKLFNGEKDSIESVIPLHPSYHSLIRKDRLLNLILDSSLYIEIKKTKALTESDH